MQRLVTAASEATALEVLQAGPDMIVVHTLMGLRALDARRARCAGPPCLPTARAGNAARHVRLFPSLDKTDRIYVGFDDRLMAYRRRRSGPVVQAADDRGLGARYRAAPQRDHHPPGITARQSGDGHVRM